MANQLINGTEGIISPPDPVKPADDTIATWGYHREHQPKIHKLKPGEGLPDGWHDSPDKAKGAAVAPPEAEPEPEPAPKDIKLPVRRRKTTGDGTGGAAG